MLFECCWNTRTDMKTPTRSKIMPTLMSVVGICSLMMCA